MIISIVSRYNEVGKSHAAEVIERSFRGTGWHSFTLNLYKATRLFLGKGDGRSKYDKHPDLGVSEKELNISLSEKLTEMHPDLPVWRVKQDIEWSLSNESIVVTDDTRRQREFLWLDDLAAKHGTKHHVVEIVPVGRIKEQAREDTWSNGIEPCGYEVWEDSGRSILFNDGTDEFDQAVLRTVEGLMEGKCRIIGPF